MSAIYHPYYLEKLEIIESIKKQVIDLVTIVFAYNDGSCTD